MVDSIKNLIHLAKSDTLKAKYYTYLADRSDDDNRKEAWKLLDSATYYAKKANSILWEMHTNSSRGLLFLNLGQADSALKYFSIVLKHENDTTMILPVARTYGNLVLLYRQKGDFENSLKYALKSEKVYLRINKFKYLPGIYTNIAGLFFDLKDIDRALMYDKKAVEIAVEHNFKDQLPSLYGNLAAAFGDLHNRDSCMYYYHKALKVATELDDVESMANSNQNLGYEYFDEEKLDSAKYFLSKARIIYEENDFYDDSYPMLYNTLGMIASREKNYTQALIYLNKADSTSAIFGFIVDRIEIKKSLMNVYAATGNWQKAYMYQEQSVLLKDSLQRDENIRITRDLERKYDTAKKEKENAELKSANEIQQQKISSRNKILIATIAAISFLALLLFFIFRNYKNEKKHVAVLDQLNFQLVHQRDEILRINQLLQLKVLRTQMNPHFIYNCLNAINNLVIKGDNDKASSYLLNFSKLLRMILDYSDRTFIDLEDEVKFLNLYLSLEAMRMGNDFTYEVKVPEKFLHDDIAVPSLLIQPFIENAIWHGLINKDGQKKLSVNFESAADENHLICIVEDNGVGREKAAEIKLRHGAMQHESKGIKITQERIELLKYQVKNDVSVEISDVVNNENKTAGTKVELILPLNG